MDRAESGNAGMSSVPPELPAERCGTCSRSRPADDASGVLHQVGWLHCEHHRAWEFVSPFHPCHFEPSKWTAKP
jgi:hypothetical protein